MTEEPRTPEPDDTAPTEPLSAGDPLGDSPKSDAPPPSSPGVRRLTRSSSDKLIGGVAGGLGRYFGVDPILFRIAFVVLTFAGGVGVLAYIGLLAFVPADDDSRVVRPAPRREPDRRRPARHRRRCSSSVLRSSSSGRR